MKMTDFFDNFKKENANNLDKAIVSLCRENDWFQTDEDWLGIVADGCYYCLGDPSAKIEKIINMPTTEHELTENENEAEEIFHAAGKTFYVIV
jgi:hypothetical protein